MKILKKNWWIFAFQGLALGVIGSLAIFNAEMTLANIVQYLALLFLGFGLILTLSGWRTRAKSGVRWLFILIVGILEMALGLLILIYPNDSTDIFIYIIGGFALMMALAQIFLAFSAKNAKLLFFINAIIGAVFGLLMIWNPFDSEKSLTYLVGFYSILLGIAVIYYSFRIRNWAGKKLETGEDPPK